MPIALLILCSLLLQAPQEVVIHSHPYIPPPASTLTAETNLVEAGLVIRDNRGRPMGGFHASDFQVFDNGKPEEILSFTESKLPEPGAPSAASTSVAPSSNSPSAAAPAKVITLFFDDLHTESLQLMHAVGAARKYVTTAIAPTDRIAIVTSSNTADLDFTNSTEALQAKLDQIRPHTRPPIASCPALQPVEAYLFLKNTDASIKTQAINDAKACICGPGGDSSCLNSKATTLTAPGMAASAAETVWGQAELQSNNALAALGEAARRLSATNGTRIMVLISTGFLPPMQRQMETVINAALRWNITIHSLDAKGLDAELESLNGEGTANLHVGRTHLTRQTAGWEPLEKISQGTGGHFFHNTNDLAGVIQMAAAPAVSYLLTFNPGGRDGKFHDLKVAFKNKAQYSLQFRPGYFSPPDIKKEALNRAALDAAVFSKESVHDLRADVACTPGHDSVSVAITLDLNRVEFKSVNNRHVQQIVFLMTLLDSSGSFVTGKEAVMDLNLTDEKLASLQKEGLKAVATLNAPAGIYQVRTIVREAIRGSLAASTLPLDLQSH